MKRKDRMVAEWITAVCFGDSDSVHFWMDYWIGKSCTYPIDV